MSIPPKLLSKDEDNPDLDNSEFLLLLLLRYVVELKRQPYDERLNWLLQLLLPTATPMQVQRTQAGNIWTSYLVGQNTWMAYMVDNCRASLSSPMQLCFPRMFARMGWPSQFSAGIDLRYRAHRNTKQNQKIFFCDWVGSGAVKLDIRGSPKEKFPDAFVFPPSVDQNVLIIKI